MHAHMYAVTMFKAHATAMDLHEVAVHAMHCADRHKGRGASNSTAPINAPSLLTMCARAALLPAAPCSCPC